jgi:5'-3' exonuclease
MGIPLFFKILSEKYASPIVDVSDMDGIVSLFIDMNCMIHPCCRKLLDIDYNFYKKKQYETKMFHEIENYLTSHVCCCQCTTFCTTCFFTFGNKRRFDFVFI